jgi:hypothetical protein
MDFSSLPHYPAAGGDVDTRHAKTIDRPSFRLRLFWLAMIGLAAITLLFVLARICWLLSWDRPFVLAIRP